MNSKIFEEDLSVSYLRAIAAQAEVDFNLNRTDTESRDANLSKIITVGNNEFNAELNVQLKATYSKSQYQDNGNSIVYKLKSKNYNDLCRVTTTPIILCLLILPEDKNEWVTQTANDLTLRYCMYWLSLKGNVPTQNTKTCNVTIPKSQIITVRSLSDLLNSIAKNGGEL